MDASARRPAGDAYREYETGDLDEANFPNHRLRVIWFVDRMAEMTS